MSYEFAYLEVSMIFGWRINKNASYESCMDHGAPFASEQRSLLDGSQKEEIQCIREIAQWINTNL